MNTLPLWTALRKGEIIIALRQLEQVPECSLQIEKLIRDCITAFNVEFKGADSSTTVISGQINWLTELAENHDLKPIFRNWLEDLEIGFTIPETVHTRFSVLEDLLIAEEPIFEFFGNHLTQEQRFLVDFGLASITPFNSGK